MSNIDTVKQIYAAFGRRDIPAIIEKLDSNVEWDVDVPTPGVPWLQPREGAANIPAFFESLAPISFQRFEPHTLFEDGNKVFALIAMDVTHNPSGKQYRFAHEGHLWHFNEAGKVVKYQHVTIPLCTNAWQRENRRLIFPIKFTTAELSAPVSSS